MTDTDKSELREHISRTMGWWRHETDDYYGHDGYPRKTDKVLALITQARIDELQRQAPMFAVYNRERLAELQAKETEQR